ncbi:substrate-binding domain-containing protein [Undibacterium arcticum]
MTHAAIAAYILCGKADAGLGVETAARQFDLDFYSDTDGTLFPDLR